MSSNDDIDEQPHDLLGDGQDIVPLPSARYGEGVRCRCMVLPLINSFSAASKIGSLPATFKQVTSNAQAWRASHPVRRDDLLAPELPHWGFPRVYLTRHNLEIMWESGRGHACMPGSVRHSVSARTNSLLSVAVSSEARIALCTTVEFAGLVEAESGEDGDANRNGSCSNSLMLHWSGTIVLLISIYSYWPHPRSADLIVLSFFSLSLLSSISLSSDIQHGWQEILWPHRHEPEHRNWCDCRSRFPALRL
jgi:hypothetical protein